MTMNTINSLRMVLIYAVEFLDIIPDSAKADPDIAAISQMIAAYDALAPKPDAWPDGVQWYAIDANGVATFFDVEPEWEMSEWVIDWRSYPNEPLILNAPKIDVPIGIDWRLLKYSRPEVTA